ncbi:MAG: hypothetical protein KGK11_05010 [Sphingomonadales bacterium]|nr:hypothetical protein [Sphingomonadales bacterium]
MPVLSRPWHRLADGPLRQWAVFTAVALLLRASTLGDPNLHADETFYFAAGIAMHHGVLPYVGVWDRKPFGLFLIYYLLAGFSAQPIAYQLGALASVVATAAAIAAMARRWTNAQGAVLAGVLYLVMLGPLQGFGGQSPVFYNLFMALAALLVLGALPALRKGEAPARMLAAMALAGFAATVKTTAIFEAVFLGLYATVVLARARPDKRAVLPAAAVWALAGAAPALLFAAAYAAIGHGSEYLHAMVTGGLNAQSDWPTAAIRLRILFGTIAPYLVLCAFGLLDQERRGRLFLSGWLAAALVGLVSVPRFYLHYALPLALPLALAAAPFLGRRWWGPLALLAAAGASLHDYWPFDFTHTQKSRAAMAQLAQAIDQHRHGHALLVFDGPVLLYAMTGQPFLSPLVFPPHLNHAIERDASHLSTIAEVRRVLALNPGVVVNTVKIRNGPANMETRAAVLRYIATRCHSRLVVKTYEALASPDIAVFGDCAPVVKGAA